MNQQLIEYMIKVNIASFCSHGVDKFLRQFKIKLFKYITAVLTLIGGGPGVLLGSPLFYHYCNSSEKFLKILSRVFFLSIPAIILLIKELENHADLVRRLNL